MRKNTFMKYALLFSTAVFVLFVSFNCSNPTAPKQNNPPDTTSSNFIWTVDTIGTEGSVLYDICIINDSLAYATGSIYLKDSTGKSNLAHPYNLMRWNGRNWEYFTLRYFPPGSVGDSAYGPGTSVFANNSNDIWVSAVVPFHFDGSRWRAYYNTGAEAANKIWESPNRKQLYFVGNNGLITYSPDQGSTWKKVETGTALPFQDIWGDGGQVLAIASDRSVGARQLYSLHGNTATVVSDSGLYYVFGGLWFSANQKYYIAGDGVFFKSSLNQPAWYRYTLGEVASYYSDAIRGNGLNNIVIAGDFADISFYNGVRWREYKELYSPIDKLRSVSIKGNTIVAVGTRTYNGIRYYGVVYVGRR